MKRATLLSLTLLLVALPAAAGQKIVLDDPVMGPPMKVWGMASFDYRNGVEYFSLRADAGLKDGSTLVVSVRMIDEPSDEWVDVAKANVVLGTALVTLNSKQHVSPVFPLRRLAQVRVSYRGRTILQGTF